MKYKTYRKQRYLFFWLSIIVYFLPTVIAVSCLLPLMQEAQGLKWAIGLSVIAINTVPFLTGIFKAFRAHFPFLNMLSFFFVALATFFISKTFQRYAYSFVVIEAVAMVASLASCVLWALHRKYKRKAQTVHDVIKSGLLTAVEDKHD